MVSCIQQTSHEVLVWGLRLLTVSVWDLVHFPPVFSPFVACWKGRRTWQMTFGPCGLPVHGRNSINLYFVVSLEVDGVGTWEKKTQTQWQLPPPSVTLHTPKFNPPTCCCTRGLRRYPQSVRSSGLSLRSKFLPAAAGMSEPCFFVEG